MWTRITANFISNVFLDFNETRLRTLTYIQNFFKDPKTNHLTDSFDICGFNLWPSWLCSTSKHSVEKITSNRLEPRPQLAHKEIEPLSIPEFNEWRQKIRTFETLHVPRNLINGTEIKNRDLHNFTDSSEFALRAVTSLRIAFKDNTISINFFTGKARVASIKWMTMANLELQAAFYGARMAPFMVEESDYKTCNQNCRSESTTVLHWLRMPQDRHKIFVTNQLARISATLTIGNTFQQKRILSITSLEIIPLNKWRFSRAGCRDITISLEDQIHWPQEDLLQLNQTTVQMMPANNSTVQCHALKPLRFSNWSRLVRSVVFCYLYVENFKKQNSHPKLSHHSKTYTFFHG